VSVRDRRQARGNKADDVLCCSSLLRQSTTRPYLVEQAVPRFIYLHDAFSSTGETSNVSLSPLRLGCQPETNGIRTSASTSIILRTQERPTLCAGLVSDGEDFSRSPLARRQYPGLPTGVARLRSHWPRQPKLHSVFTLCCVGEVAS
jgi:hypothetical protein